MHNINANGMHAKVKTANDYVNIWPQSNILSIPNDAMEVYIIALSKTEENACNTYPVNLETRDILVNNQNNDQQSGQQSSVAVHHYNFRRHGNSMISQSNFGKRSLFNYQKRASGTPAPLKLKNLLNWNKY